MTRPMPGPPECDPQASPHESVPFNGGDFPMCDRHYPHPLYRKSKHLTDAGCAAEFWNAMVRAQYIAWAPNDLLGIDIPADGQLYKVTRPDPDPLWDEAETWHRFVTSSHAFKETQ